MRDWLWWSLLILSFFVGRWLAGRQIAQRLLEQRLRDEINWADWKRRHPLPDPDQFSEWDRKTQ